jgi:hypothetical protein
VKTNGHNNNNEKENNNGRTFHVKENFAVINTRTCVWILFSVYILKVTGSREADWHPPGSV